MVKPKKEVQAAELHPGANEAYGRLLEGVHVAGYTFERACAKLEWLLDGDRWRKVGSGFDDVNAFLESVKLDKFKQLPQQRKRIAARIKELQPTATVRAIAAATGGKKSTAHRDLSQMGQETPKTPSKTGGGNEALSQTGQQALTGAAAAGLVRRREGRKARDAEAAAVRLEVVGSGSIECRHGDFRSVLADLTNIDAIITDPPYGKEYLHLLRELAVLADRILKPDGVMAVLYGQTYLPEAIAQMTGFRPYRWTACYLTEGNAYVSHARKLQSKWKPLLIYGSGEQRFNDLFRSTDSDGAAKENHKWGQDLAAFQSIIGALTNPGAMIVDPFAGGGTTLVAAKALGRNAIGSEIDATAAAFKLTVQRSAA